MEEQLLKSRYDLKEMELNSLLEITQAINNNLPEESLYKIFHFTLRANLNIKKLALYVLDEKWHCRVNFGTNISFFKVPLAEHFLNTKNISFIDSVLEDTSFKEFDTVLPVFHKNKTLAIVFIGGREESKFGSSGTSTNFIQALSNIIIVAIENKKLARRELNQRALQKELEIASQVQQFLFPKELPNTEELKLAASYLPHHTVGGDYYDFIKIDENKFLLCIADVSGKGIPAAILMSNFQASLRTLVRKTTNLREIVQDLNYHILQNSNGDHFITSFLGIYNKKNKVLEYVNSGHNQPILLVGKEPHLLDKGSTVLGFFHPLPFLNEGKIDNLEEFLFFSYTDGVVETYNENSEEFGSEWLSSYLVENSENEPEQIHREVLEKLNEFKGKKSFSDDITIFSCKVKVVKK
jgi:phosphoserine phosphatase RsbU/P